MSSGSSMKSYTDISAAAAASPGSSSGNMKVIDIRSDTVTKPSADMYEAMVRAPVGDDVMKEDPTVNG